jgi:hypothetical protein
VALCWRYAIVAAADMRESAAKLAALYHGGPGVAS